MMHIHLSNTQTNQDYYTQFAIIKKERKRKHWVFFKFLCLTLEALEKASNYSNLQNSVIFLNTVQGLVLKKLLKSKC